MDWVDFAVEHEVDLLAVSFVRSADDLRPVNERIRSRGADIPLIAKIEKPQALENTEEIIEEATSGIMVARGDLGIELPIEEMPPVQKRLIRLAGQMSKPVITATQMLASMTESERPTRAEVTDVANAIYDGTDAVMLSEETAVGANPLAAVRMMDRIAGETERDLPYEHWLFDRVEIGRGRRRRRRRPGGRRRHLPARHQGDRRPDPQRSHGAPRLGDASAGPDRRGLTAQGDGAAPEPAVRGALLLPRRMGRGPRAARRLRRDRPRGRASPKPASWSRSPPGCPIRSSAPTCSRSTASSAVSERRGPGDFAEGLDGELDGLRLSLDLGGRNQGGCPLRDRCFFSSPALCRLCRRAPARRGAGRAGPWSRPSEGRRRRRPTAGRASR